MLCSMTGMTCPILNEKRTLRPRTTVVSYPMATWTATKTLGRFEPSTKVRRNTPFPWYDIQHNNYGILAGGIPEFFNELHAYNLVYATCPDLAKGMQKDPEFQVFQVLLVAQSAFLHPSHHDEYQKQVKDKPSIFQGIPAKRSGFGTPTTTSPNVVRTCAH